MSVEDGPPNEQKPPQVPATGTLLVDTGRRDQVGEFRGTAGPYWSLRPVCGGTEWEAEPANVRAPSPMERLRAETARCNARSEGRIL
ncbi:hypothetical protein GCM10015535_57140 [Streptomyces gelaticus]|uniref:Uncharacterized protein n=1 Tax=Streptomyces gelaticus TaxID=285446 RepID=A0ABQ2W7X6_9ACTN|nr:hypothetical protein [Streptomyces gelaticus]GGV93677.1 hypothetical protein GCM10015535_57140 [Streptomyces gelaticus]